MMYKIFTEDEGAAAVEYALLISLIGMTVAGALHVLGDNFFNTLSVVIDVFSSVQFKDDLFKPN